MNRHRTALLAACGALALAGLPAAAQAHHITDAIYTGTHQYGGAVEFKLSPTGNQVVFFDATTGSPPVENPCPPSYIADDFQNVPIENHAFDARGTFAGFDGLFSSIQGASGTLLANKPTSFSTCTSWEGTWTATTTASNENSLECVEAKAAVAKAQKRLANATTPKAKRKARAKLRKAKQEQRDAC